MCAREAAPLDDIRGLGKGRGALFALDAAQRFVAPEGMSVLRAISISQKPARAFWVLGMFWGTFAAYIPEFKTNLGVDDAVFGTLLLFTSFGLATAMWLAPRVDRRFGALAMPGAMMTLGGAFLLPGFSASPTTFAGSMHVVGMAAGLTDVTMNARVSDLENYHSRPLMNANHGVFSLAYACAAIAAGFARELQVPPNVMFAALGGLAIVMALGARMDTSASEPSGVGATSLPWRPILLCGLLVLIAFLAEAAAESWSAIHVERTLGGSAGEGAMAPAMLGLTMAFGRFAGQAVTEKFNKFNVMGWAGLLAAFGAIVAAAAPTPMVAYLGFGALGLGVSVIGPLGLALAGQIVPAAARTRAISVTAVVGFAGFFFAPFAMGGLSQHFGLRVAFAAVAVLFLALVYLLPALRRRTT